MLVKHIPSAVSVGWKDDLTWRFEGHATVKSSRKCL